MSTDTNFHAALGKAISELRRDRQVTQENLAFHAGLHRTSISLIERGCKSPTFDTLYLIATALSIKTSDLVVQAELIASKLTSKVQ